MIISIGSVQQIIEPELLNHTTSMQRIFLALPSVILIVGCSQPNEYKPPPPPSVTVARPVVRTVTDYLEETGTTEAVERVEIRARVSGYLQEVSFQDGQDVRKGDKLYLIQPQEYEAKVAAEKANVESMNVTLTRAEIEFKRQTNMLKKNAASQSSVDTALAARDGAAAALDAANAALKLAELDLEYTAITAPIDGRVERTLVRGGNLVGGSEATHLTTVMKYDPIFVYFNISERALLLATAMSDDGAREKVDLKQIKAYVRRTLDKGFPFEGNLDYADLGVDQSTGTFTVRAKFPNPDRNLFPGLFVRIRIPVGTTENAVLIPERSVGADQAGRYVMIVADNNIAERRNVILGAKFGEMVVVIEGLDGKETIVVDGLQRARPGATVTPKVIQLEEPDLTQTSVNDESQPVPASAESEMNGSDALEPSDAHPTGDESAPAARSTVPSSTEPLNRDQEQEAVSTDLPNTPSE